MVDLFLQIKEKLVCLLFYGFRLLSSLFPLVVLSASALPPTQGCMDKLQCDFLKSSPYGRLISTLSRRTNCSVRKHKFAFPSLKKKKRNPNKQSLAG